MTTGKTIALIRWTFVGKVMSLLLNMLSRLVITFLPRSKRLLISWLKRTSLDRGKKRPQLQTRKSQMRKLNGKGKHTVNVGNHPHTNMIYKQI